MNPTSRLVLVPEAYDMFDGFFSKLSEPSSGDTLNRRNIFYLILTTCTLIIISLVLYLITLVINSRFVTIDLLYTPASATATINGKSYSAGQLHLPVGDYEIKVEKLGFESQTLSVSASETSVSAYFILSSNDPSTSDWYFYHPDDAKISEGISSYMFDNASINLSTAYPFLSDLPIKKSHFELYHASCPNYDFCIAIDASPKYYEEALAYFRSHYNKNLGNYHFLFLNHFNPFKGEG